MNATASIYHHPDAIERADTPLAGRRAAGQSFLQGYARHVQADRLHCVADTPKVIEDFRALMQSYDWSGPIDGALISRPRDLSVPGTIMLPGPGLEGPAWVRRRVGTAAYSLCGITHTVSTRRIMEGLFNMIAAPVEAWDAIICTSRAVHDVVDQQITETVRYMARRFGARRVPRPMLPIIPLGIDTARFAHNPAARQKLRHRFDVADSDIVLLSMGRLSVFEKMHPAPLFIAAQKAAKTSGKRIVLMMAGWFSDAGQEKLHDRAAKALAPDVTVIFPDGKDPELRTGLWSAADIFVFPVDNLQETFGLAPVEAMAAGLPVVCSDWNGFRDTIEHDVTGFLVRTVMSAPHSGAEIAERFEDQKDKYLQYLAFAHMRTSVDVAEMAGALSALAVSPERRAEMGAAGVARARRLYDWSAVIPQYQALWAEQSVRRQGGLQTSSREADEPPNPAAMDPFTLYRGYPSDRLTQEALVSADREMTQVEIEELLELTGAGFIRRYVTSAARLARVHAAICAAGPVRVRDLVDQEMPATLVSAAVLWLAKYDCVQIEH